MGEKLKAPIRVVGSVLKAARQQWRQRRQRRQAHLLERRSSGQDAARFPPGFN
jgi:hypothetical protein